MHMHKAGFGADCGRRQTRQNRVLELTRDASTSRQKGLTGRVSVVGALEHPGDGVRDIVDARAGQPLFSQEGDGFVQVAATVFEGRGRTAHDGEKASEQLGNDFACPGIRDGNPNTVDPLQREGIWSALMVMGVTGQDRHNLPGAQANAAVDHPDEAVTQGRQA